MRLRLGLGSKRKRSGGIPAFLPTDIAGLQLWLDASDTATITHAANAVSQWNDKSGNANHATQGTGSKQPTTNTRTLNGLNVLDFNQLANNNMYVGSGIFAIPTGNSTNFVVARADTLSGNRHFISWTTATQNRDWKGMKTNSGTPIIYRAYGTNALPAGMDIGVATDPKIVSDRTLGTVITSFVNGVASPAGVSSNSLPAMTNFYIGSYNDTFDMFDGVFAEILSWNFSMSNAQKNLVGNYLASKWSIPWTNL